MPSPLQLIHHTGMNGGTNAKELEATLGLKLEHPNIVRTFEFATRSSGSVRVQLFQDLGFKYLRTLDLQRISGSATLLLDGKRSMTPLVAECQSNTPLADA
jgi:hypothetical protein